MSNPWVNTWMVTGTSGKTYTVARRAGGGYGCSCPAWKFQHNGADGQRSDCQHIMKIRLSEMIEERVAAMEEQASKQFKQIKPTESVGTGITVIEVVGRKYRQEQEE